MALIIVAVAAADPRGLLDNAVEALGAATVTCSVRVSWIAGHRGWMVFASRVVSGIAALLVATLLDVVRGHQSVVATSSQPRARPRSSPESLLGLSHSANVAIHAA